MAIDYIIGALQLLSAAVNILALASFWITPGLRTTANRFVINLLIVNIVGCLALTPALWLHGGLIPSVYNESVNNELHPIPSSIRAIELNATLSVKPTVFIEVISTNQYNEDDDVEIIAKIKEDDQKTISNRTNNTTWSPTKNIQYSDCTRFWGFDLVAALGKRKIT